MKIFLVLGESGDYEARREWAVCAYTSHADAVKHADAADAAAKAYYESIKDDPFSYEDEELRQYTGSLDPYARALRAANACGCGTTYEVLEVDLNDSFALR